MFMKETRQSLILHALGIDVTHPAPGAQRPSMAGLVASLDKSASKYIATTSIQPPRVEIVESLFAMLMVSYSVVH